MLHTNLKHLETDEETREALENKMKSLVGSRIIYPDGTMNSFGERYLR